MLERSSEARAGSEECGHQAEDRWQDDRERQFIHPRVAVSRGRYLSSQIEPNEEPEVPMTAALVGCARKPFPEVCVVTGTE